MLLLSRSLHDQPCIRQLILERDKCFEAGTVDRRDLPNDLPKLRGQSVYLGMYFSHDSCLKQAQRILGSPARQHAADSSDLVR